MSKIGLLFIATNKYKIFVQQLITSADNFLLKNHDVTYFMFTDQEINVDTNRSLVKIGVEHKPWPWMTLGRYHIFSQSEKYFEDMDYLFYCDVDMKFVDFVGDEVLSDRVATQHPCFVNQRGTPETNPISTACVYPNEEMQYFAGGFNGGKTDEYLKMAKIISKNIETDYNNGYIAIWHDESHINRYFINNRPTKILDSSYCCVESDINNPFGRKLLALDKNHSEMRS
jgi:histo-blood group ABO system transferase